MLPVSERLDGRYLVDLHLVKDANHHAKVSMNLMDNIRWNYVSSDGVPFGCKLQAALQGEDNQSHLRSSEAGLPIDPNTVSFETNLLSAGFRRMHFRVHPNDGTLPR